MWYLDKANKTKKVDVPFFMKVEINVLALGLINVIGKCHLVNKPVTETVSALINRYKIASIYKYLSILSTVEFGVAAVAVV